MSKLGIASASLGLLVTLGFTAQAQARPRVYTPDPQADNQAYPNDAPQVDVWLDEYTYRFGDIIRPRFIAEPGAYVTIVRVSSDGDLRVLYPRVPQLQVRYRDGDLAYDRIPVSSDGANYVKESRGTGFVFAIASFNRFNYSYYSSGNFWSTARLANAGRFGNPFQIMRSFAEETVGGNGDYSIDYEMYTVEGSQYRSRYASRYNSYSYNDYLESCLDTFGPSWYSYCSSRNHYYGPLIVVSNPPSNPSGSRKNMRIKPLVVDPVVPNVPLHPQPLEGRLPVTNPSEDAAMARREQMLRSARPRVGGDTGGSSQAAPRIYRPAAEPSVSRPAPRNDAPRAEPQVRRAEPPPQQQQPRVEVRNDPPQQAAPPPPRAEPSQKVERPHKDN
jgi:hypothetical protein